MKQPEGFVVPGEENPVRRLKKSLYGLKHAPQQGYKWFDAFKIEQGYIRCHYDNCIYFQQFGGSFVYLLLYVDDMLIASKDKSLINKLKCQLSDEFEMKDLGATKKILGLEIHRDRKAGKLYLSQRKYLEKILDRLNMSNCKSVSTPLAAHFKLSFESYPKTKQDLEKMSHVPYSIAVDSLMYAMACTRPDLSYAVSVVSRFMHNPGNDHLDDVKWILRYVRCSRNKCLVFDRFVYNFGCWLC